MLQRVREQVALLLIGLLPLHAFLVTVGTKMLEGPGHAPLPVLALWKEILLLVILLLATAEFSVQKQRRIRFDRLDACILVLLALSLLVTALTHGNWKLYLFGFKYDFIPLIAFLVLRRVSWSTWFQRAAVAVIMTVGGMVALYGLATLALPMSFFRALGYSDLHSLYLPGGPLAAFQQVGGAGVRRIQSTLSGPNQLGLWLLLPWSFCLVRLSLKKPLKHIRVLLLLSAVGRALLFTFSRTAWLAALVIAVVFAIKVMPGQRAGKHLIQLFGAGVILLVVATIISPTTVVRFASSRDHLLKPLAAAQSVFAHPFGQGLGIAGPASNRVSDACVFLEAGADTGWAADRPDLCVFVGGEQMQPADRACSCPFVTENWYLQTGVEMGLLGFVIFLTLIILVLLQLTAVPAVFLPFLGISVAGLFLHAWEESAVAYTLWMLVAAQIQQKR
ncbi:MAG: hypothetical protein UY85_C0034G0010 [Candidatus Peribacteria bacterium GW2011_GWB1_54_5]|nr:MAG: hypothetical protein UY85_C0034G0010 [Candidatus Peribacteria bacterium GW2011_GWB1_54_5]